MTRKPYCGNLLWQSGLVGSAQEIMRLIASKLTTIGTFVAASVSANSGAGNAPTSTANAALADINATQTIAVFIR